MPKPANDVESRANPYKVLTRPKGMKEPSSPSTVLESAESFEKDKKFDVDPTKGDESKKSSRDDRYLVPLKSIKGKVWIPLASGFLFAFSDEYQELTKNDPIKALIIAFEHMSRDIDALGDFVSWLGEKSGVTALSEKALNAVSEGLQALKNKALNNNESIDSETLGTSLKEIFNSEQLKEAPEEEAESRMVMRR